MLYEKRYFKLHRMRIFSSINVELKFVVCRSTLWSTDTSMHDVKIYITSDSRTRCDFPSVKMVNWYSRYRHARHMVGKGDNGDDNMKWWHLNKIICDEFLFEYLWYFKGISGFIGCCINEICGSNIQNLSS